MRGYVRYVVTTLIVISNPIKTLPKPAALLSGTPLTAFPEEARGSYDWNGWFWN